MTESIMSRNFVHYGNGGSEYTDAMLAAQRARSSMAARQMGILATGKAAVAMLGPDASYAEISLEARKAGRRMEEEKDTATHEASERNLEEQKENIEKRAQEALTGSEDGALATDAPTGEEEALTADASDSGAQDAVSDGATDDSTVKTTEDLIAEQQRAEQQRAEQQLVDQQDASAADGAATASTTLRTPFHLVV